METNFCVACNADVALHVHHLVPKSLGGDDSPTNTITLCESCHGKIHGRRFLDHKFLTRQALDKKRSRGERCGRCAPYGFAISEDGKTLIPNHDERVAMQLAKTLRASGMPLRTIAAHLEAQGHAPRGKRFDPQTIKRMSER